MNVAIRNDQVGRRIYQIEQDILALVNQQETKKKQAEQYNALARAVNLPEYGDEMTFLANVRQVSALIVEASERVAWLTGQRDEQKQQETSLKATLRELGDGLNSQIQRVDEPT